MLLKNYISANYSFEDSNTDDSKDILDSIAQIINETERQADSDDEIDTDQPIFSIASDEDMIEN